MQSAAERMQNLIQGLLTLSRVTTKGQDFVPVDLAAVAAEVVSDLEVQIQQAQGQVELGHMPRIMADPLQIRQLLQNLIGNALKFRREDEPPVVRVDARFVGGRAARDALAGEQCRLVVEDNGIGFEEQYAERIFGVFQRLHTREAYPGTGIGLAICKKIAERHGGSITAHSTPGQGSTFTVLLPAVHRKPKG
jgi:signal transduction histidine kinase